MTIPNMLTIFRMLLVPVFAFLFLSDMKLQAMLVFALAGITDVLDGWVARKFEMESDIGKLLDPLADKMMTLCVVGVLAYVGYLPNWIIIVFVAKEVIMIIGSSMLYKKEVVVQSNIFGKLATVFFYAAVFTLYFSPGIGLVIMYIAAVASVLALLNYIVVYKRHGEKFGG
ncbi:CDP-diacylglycerol--glycerol-3-phosphate 3-phosphatidyltransferase [Peptoclostridium litorale DSM 5388]|uniref:CDP-diacylglycerol--glycerol-3-phosphate 3-phosphatidyltransferase n=1 Tax=Peptoclostridium litorale DSM 5388 TaxID=1121324 RepID=A0A069RIQ9_PEPLI|nr:CDP-diacylglycerol--glycerol-3-phosphate 3-phosphatidyltransferase [Peptoclostridium litorale]KDR96663.1 CDP-diacylglycerol--glycerol-3-phosphate 3-phosphatidyltransferase [Peptoclostridium litorale DSM 5388]SIN67949.1 CDP-diacylglycerol--glycerol-3-phosphate 3-phosphatidyltransferase [Peptoclostridium litorale DSM 5388]